MGVTLRHHRYVMESNQSRETLFRNDSIHAYNKRNSQFYGFYGQNESRETHLILLPKFADFAYPACITDRTIILYINEVKWLTDYLANGLRLYSERTV